MKEQTTKELEPPEKIGCFGKAVGIVLALQGLIWFVRGQIVVPYKGIFVEGVMARVAAVLWIIFCLSVCITKRRGKSNEEVGEDKVLEREGEGQKREIYSEKGSNE